LLGSGRTKIETQEQLDSALKVAQGFDGIVIIGGDDSHTNAAVLAEFFLQNDCKTRVIGVPKTIDGDLQNPFLPISFGFDTATKTYGELIGNIAKDVLSSKKYYHFIKLMGRSASHVTLECGLKTHPNLTLISEEKQSLPEIIAQICNLINARAEAGKNYGIVLVPEGLAEFIPELRTSSVDAYGNVNVSAIEVEKFLIEKVAREVKISPIAHFFGYEGRSAFPTNFDATYCTTLGFVAALLIARGFTSYMACVHNLRSNWMIGGVPLTPLMHFEERKGKKSAVIAKTVVDLQGRPYQYLKKVASKWALEDDYQSPGPIQFFGDPKLTDSIPLICSI